MPNEPRNLIIDRSILLHLQELAASIIDRMESIKQQYPEGTFEEMDGDGPDEVIDDIDIEAVEEEPAPPTPAKRAPKRKGSGKGLSDSIRAEVAATGKLNIKEFATVTGYEYKSVSGVASGMLKHRELSRIAPGTYGPGPKLKRV